MTVTVSEWTTTPSSAVSVNAIAVSESTWGAVKEASSAEASSVMGRVELCDQEYVRVSSVSESATAPSRLTAEPSAAVWSGPALTVGGLLGESVTVTCRVSETSTVPSSTVRVTVMVVLAATSGAVNDADKESEPVMVIERVSSWVHEYARVSSGSSSETVPERVTVAPSATSWSCPALTVGGLLGESGSPAGCQRLPRSRHLRSG